MQLVKNNKAKKALLSITLHCLLFFLISSYFTFSTPYFNLGNTDDVIINSYIYPDHANQLSINTAKKIAEKQSEKRKESIIRKKIDNALVMKQIKSHLQKSISKSTEAKKISTEVSKETSPANKGRQLDELAALLHTAIQKQQHYPEAAMQMEREGRVTLSFILYPDGTIRDLHIIKSSHTSSLDEAAIAAVRDAVPFQQVDRYLRTPQSYQLDVVFELT